MRAFFPELVRQLLTRRGLANEKAYTEQLGPHEWWLPKLAEAIPVSAGKLADWARGDGSTPGGRPRNACGFSGLTSRS